MHRAILANVFVGAAVFVFVTMAPIAALAQDRTDGLWTRASEKIDPKALPLGNGKYSDAPKAGFIYPCAPHIYYSIGWTGARAEGPWLHGSTWDLTEKIWVQGAVMWPNAKLDISVSGDRRVIKTNNLPFGRPTGVFPVQPSDPAYRYDPNPNPIEPQSFAVMLPVNPHLADKPSCIELPIAVGLDGVVFFSALDSHARDEPAYELQDRCGGMSAPGGIYHRYMPSDCLPDIRERNALVGYALDGFGVFSPYDADGKELSTKDLDECHGMTSPVLWDGKMVNMYHYVLTRDYPYSIGCFRGTPTRIPMPPPPMPAFDGMPGAGGMPGPGGGGGPMPGPGPIPVAPFPGMDAGFTPPPFAAIQAPGAMPGGMGGPMPGPAFAPPTAPRPAISPRRACEERADRRAASRDRLKAMLQLTTEQEVAWRRFEQAAVAATDQERQSCATLPAEPSNGQVGPLPLPQRLENIEKQLAVRLERLRRAREAFRSLYDALSPEQRSRLDRLPTPAG